MARHHAAALATRLSPALGRAAPPPARAHADSARRSTPVHHKVVVCGHVHDGLELQAVLLRGRLDGLLVHNNQIYQPFAPLYSLFFTSKEISSTAF